jgi:hypothetical protein
MLNYEQLRSRRNGTMLPAYKYRHLLWALISALDSDDFDSLDIDEVKRRAESDKAGQWFKATFSDYDLSMLDPKDWEHLDWEFGSMYNAIDASRKFGVDNKGIALLLGYVLQGMQGAMHEERRSK